MSSVTRLDVLKLYRNLLRYGETLKFTDKGYYKKRIRGEFQKNKILDNPEEIDFSWKVRKRSHFH